MCCDSMTRTQPGEPECANALGRSLLLQAECLPKPGRVVQWLPGDLYAMHGLDCRLGVRGGPGTYVL